MAKYFLLSGPESDRLKGMPAVENPWKGPRCSRGHVTLQRKGDLALEVRHSRGDELMIWSWLSECAVHASLLQEFQNRGLIGYRLRPATVRFRDGRLSTDYHELLPVGWAGVARPESGVRLIDECPECHVRQYSALLDAGELIDWRQWTGEDFFIVWPLLRFTLITERVADVLMELRVKSYSLEDLRTLEKRDTPPALRTGFAAAPLSEYFPEDLADKYGKPLGLE